ncbi:MAG: hypothetical protein WB607_05360 [Candidatus Acidiferrum sp.]
MNPVPKISRWQKGKVDRTKEHFELRYGSARDSDWSEWIPIAVIGRPKGRIVNVEFLVDCAEPENAKAVHDVEEEIQFYLIDKEEPNPGVTPNTIAGRDRISTARYTGHSSRHKRTAKRD